MGVPIAVPDSWSQNVSAKVKTLLRITSSRMRRKRFVGKSLEIFSLLCCRNSLNVSIPRSVSMFVYIDFASAEKIFAPFGSVKDLRSFKTSVEFLV